MPEGSLGRAGFAQTHGLSNSDRETQARDVIARIAAENIEIVRLSFVDQHGVLRGKTVPANSVTGALQNGCSMTSSLLLKDTSHHTVFPVWSVDAVLGSSELVGAGDIVMLPDPTTFQRLPWSPRTGWMLCDIYLPSGSALEISTRGILRRSVQALAARNLSLHAGLEIEFHVFKLEDAKLDAARSGHPAEAPDVSLTAHGYQYLTESRADEMEPVTELIRHAVQGLNLPLRSIEVEFGPSQYEFTFDPAGAMEQADAMVLFRSAVIQVCRRAGYHATFMCRPALPNIFSSGWHLHQSLLNTATGANTFIPATSAEPLSPVGRHYVAGLLQHACAAMVLTTPTINGYKRYQPMAMAPDRVVWSRDNKGAMIRALGGPGDVGTRIENRIGEPAANPYLYLASQIESGLAGIATAQEPPPPSATPYHADAPKLPGNLWESIQAFKGSSLFRNRFGDVFVDYLATIKEAEFNRFMRTVTDWEQREYF